jgi:hypothetical protein
VLQESAVVLAGEAGEELQVTAAVLEAAVVALVP